MKAAEITELEAVQTDVDKAKATHAAHLEKLRQRTDEIRNHEAPVHQLLDQRNRLIAGIAIASGNLATYQARDKEWSELLQKHVANENNGGIFLHNLENNHPHLVHAERYARECSRWIEAKVGPLKELEQQIKAEASKRDLKHLLPAELV